MALYAEFENENSFRSFPFAEGTSLSDSNGETLDTSSFIDAMLYPDNPSGRVRLSAIDFEEDLIEISDDDGVIGTGQIEDVINVVSTDGKRIGTLLTRNLTSTAAIRREFSELYFSSSCVCAFNAAGVTGLRIGDTVMTGKIVFEKSSTITPEIVQNGNDYTLSLSVISAMSSGETPSIKKIVVMQSKGTIFGVGEYNANSIEVTLGTISREDFCDTAHREDTIDIYDICDPPDGSGGSGGSGGGYEPTVTPAQEDSFWVFDLTEKDNSDDSNTIMRQAFNIVAPNIVDPATVVNPINVQMVEGTMQSNPPKFTRTMTDAEAAAQMKKLTASNVVGNGIILQIPGL